MNAVFIFLGGGLGSLARYSLSRAVVRWMPLSFPLGTLAVNVSICLLLGLLAGHGLLRYDAPMGMRLFVAVGFCGGFSTFSSFTIENMELAKMGLWGLAGLNILASLVLCMGAMMAGIFLYKVLF